jgi:hypothetical protein
VIVRANRSSGPLQHAVGKADAEGSRLEARLTGIRNRMDRAYTDKLDGKIPEDFWERKMADWRMEEQQIKIAIQGLSNAHVGDKCVRCAEDLRTRE